MNNLPNKFLLLGVKFMSEMHLRQPGVTNSCCEPFGKNKNRKEKFKEKGDSKYIYLDKACFHHDIVHRYFRDLQRRTASKKY